MFLKRESGTLVCVCVCISGSHFDQKRPEGKVWKVELKGGSEKCSHRANSASTFEVQSPTTSTGQAATVGTRARGPRERLQRSHRADALLAPSIQDHLFNPVTRAGGRSVGKPNFGGPVLEGIDFSLPIGSGSLTAKNLSRTSIEGAFVNE